MLGKQPNKPMVQADPSERTFTCYTAPGVAFGSEEEMKAHYQTEWHRYNLKRKVAGLAPLTRELYLQRAAREQEKDAAAAAKVGGGRKQAREERRAMKVAADAANPRSKVAHHEATASMDAEAYMRYKIRHAAPFGEGSDLFSSHESADLASNLAHMARAHGFFVPWIEYCVDVPGLIKYLQEKVYVANMDLVKEKPFHSVEAVQAHMRDKSLCRFELEGNEDEYEAFYDLDALAAGSPLWDVVEEEVDDDEDWEDMDEEDEEAAAAAGGGGGGAAREEAAALEALAGAAVDDDGAFEALFARGVSLGVLSEAQVDALTDEIAGGRSQAEVLGQWSAPILAAHADRAAGGAGASSSSAAGGAMSVSGTSVVRRVRYAPMPASDDAMSMALAGKEVGHRAMRKYYRQSFRPASTALGVANPRLQALMEQYAAAGHLGDHLAARHRAVGQSAAERSGRTMADKHYKRMMVKQGITNNTTANGMKHYKNQSLNY